jgi:hypothetical protein
VQPDFYETGKRDFPEFKDLLSRFPVEPERFHATLYAALLTISDAPLPVFPVYLLSPKDMLNK